MNYGKILYTQKFKLILNVQSYAQNTKRVQNPAQKTGLINKTHQHQITKNKRLSKKTRSVLRSFISLFRPGSTTGRWPDWAGFLFFSPSPLAIELHFLDASTLVRLSNDGINETVELPVFFCHEQWLKQKRYDIKDFQRISNEIIAFYDYIICYLYYCVR